jgi:uncharacterized protein YjdB
MIARIYSLLLLLTVIVGVQRAHAQASFTGGASQSLTVCQSSGTTPINTLLQATDLNIGTTVNWTVVQNASHGMLVAAYSTAATGGTLTPAGLSYTPTVGYSGNDSFKVQVSDGVDSMTTMVMVTVVPTPNAGTISGPNAVCESSGIILNTTGSTGGTWSASNGNATVSSAGIVTGISFGTVTISYTVTNLCGSALATYPVTVNPLPVPGTISGASGVCAGSTISLTTTGSGGIWSSTNTAAATVSGAGVVSGVATGTTTISYSVTNGCGTVAATHIVTVSTSATTATLSSSLSVFCQGTAILITASIPGGVWSSSNTTIALVDSTGIVTGTGGGTATISYVITNACGSAAPATKSVTVNPLPATGTISGATTICGGVPSTLTETVPGGTWSSANPAVATISSTGVVTGVSPGTTIISYSLTNSCGLSAATRVVAVGSPFAGTITGSNTVCQGTFTTTLTTSGTGGTWSSSNPAVAGIYLSTDGDAIIAGVTAGGFALISYTVVGSCGTTAVATHLISVDAAPIPGPISGSPATCPGATTTLVASMSGGHWSSSDSSKAIAAGIALPTDNNGIVTGYAAGVVNISYTYGNTCGVAVAVRSVTVNPLATVGTITGPATVCEGDTVTLFDPLPSGTWSSSATTIATVNPTTGRVWGVAAGTAIISFTRTNVCGNNSATRVLTVSPLPDPGVITGISLLCVGSSVAFTPTVPGGTWSSGNAGVAAAVGSGTVMGVGAGTAIISYKVTNGCGTQAAVAIVTVNSNPAIPTISVPLNDTFMCPGETNALSASVGGGVWSVVLGGASGINPTTGLFTAVTPGRAVVEYTVTNSCGSSTASVGIQIRTTNQCLAETGVIYEGANGLNVYPNPSNGLMHMMLTTDQEEAATITISNVAGQTVKELTTTTNKETAVQLQVPAGMYFISARSASGSYTARVVVAE